MTEPHNNFERQLVVLDEGASIPHQRSKGAVFAIIGSEIKCDKDIFDSYCHKGWGNIHHDLLIVCAAVEFADRRWARGNAIWARHFHVTIPVIELGQWNDVAVHQHLRDTLRHLTGDEWRFSFVRHEGPELSKPRQGPLFPNQRKTFAIAYSQGLDSLSVSGLYDDNDTAVRVRVSRIKQRRRKEESPFDRLPFDVKVKPNSENSARSRGFKFAAVTAVAAQLSNVSRIVVPESFQGALGPVLLPLLNVYPDYRNHPTFFRKMERFIKALLGADIAYEQPQLWQTKGQTVAAFLAKPGMTPQQIVKTRSCWQQRFNVRVAGQFRQCGICAACLLRRMSLHAAGVVEPPEQYAVADLQAAKFPDALPKENNFKATATLYDYGYMGARHLQQLADLASTDHELIRSHAFQISESVGSQVDDVMRHLRSSLDQHAKEWVEFAQHQGESSFLQLWTKGGRHG